MSAGTCIIIVSAALLFAIRGGVCIVSYVLDCLPSSRRANPLSFSAGAQGHAMAVPSVPAEPNQVLDAVRLGDRLPPRQAQFVREYLVDLNASQAALRAGYKARTAAQRGWSLLQMPAICAAVETAMAERAARVRIRADMVLERWWRIATADPNDLVQLRRGCCRYCHGVDHLYQWIDAGEYEEAVAASAKSKTSAASLSDAGGYGYRAGSPAHPDCPRCGGRGVAEVFAADTRTLKGDAALLYAGVKETSGGVEIRMHDQLKALENVARHLGLFKDQVEHTGVTTVEIVRLTP